MKDEILCLSIEKVTCVARLQLGYETMPKKGLRGRPFKVRDNVCEVLCYRDPNQQDSLSSHGENKKYFEVCNLK